MALPYTLTNGTTADATQVMANFAYVGSGIKKATMTLDENSYLMGTSNPSYTFTLPSVNNILLYIEVSYDISDVVANSYSEPTEGNMQSEEFKINGVTITGPEQLRYWSRSETLLNYTSLGKIRAYFRTENSTKTYTHTAISPIFSRFLNVTQSSYDDGNVNTNTQFPAGIITPTDVYTIDIVPFFDVRESPWDGGGGSGSIATTLTNILISIYYVDDINVEADSDKFSVVT